MSRTVTNKEIKLVARYYPDHSALEVEKITGIPYRRVYGIAGRHKITKSDDFNSSRLSGRILPGDDKGRSFQFKKGHVPANKGKKMPAELKKRMAHTFFKKGNIPANAMPGNGFISIRKDSGTGRPYKFIKIDMGKWVHLHRKIWEDANGPVPKNRIVVFKDRNTLNCSLENLETITRKENMRRNTILNYPEELKKTIRTLAKLKKTIKNAEK